ncbi:hypothetical protein BGX20_006970 [Mortierella sp. AD010]|nr:hypothetical protein BGX20_006970 [Mortierella sp. AD010]
MSNNYYYSSTNSQGNHYCNRGESTAPGGSYHYSNTNGSYYYQNSNGSTYYCNPNTGYKSYTPSSSNSNSNGGSRSYSGRKIARDYLAQPLQKHDLLSRTLVSQRFHVCFVVFKVSRFETLRSMVNL